MKMNKKGFTLIEMLVVIAIIAILVAIIIPTVSSATTKAKEAADVANLRSWVAEYEIKTLDGSADWTDIYSASKMNFPGKYNYEDNEVTYTSTKLTDGNGSGNGANVYTWTLADLVS